MICLYVDDFLITRSHSSEIKNLKFRTTVEFEMVGLDKLSYFLGMTFFKFKKGMVMHQNVCVEVVRRV